MISRLIKTLFFAAVLLCSGIAHAEDYECAFDPASLKPVMTPPPEIAHTHKIRKAPMMQDGNLVEAPYLEEEVTLADGLKITYAVGGCAHYGFTFTFENIPGGAPEFPIDPFGLANALLRRVPMTEKPIPEAMQEEMWAMEAKEKDGEPAKFDESGYTEFNCGDALCSLVLKDSRKVEVTYSFAL